MKAIKVFIIIITMILLVTIEVISFKGQQKDILHILSIMTIIGIADTAVILWLNKFNNWFDSNLK